MDDKPDVQPWPGWIRYTLLAVSSLSWASALVVALYDKGLLPIAGPFVVLFLLPLLVPLRNRGLRTGRAGSPPVDERLAALSPALERERSLAAHGQSRASEESLAAAAAQIASPVASWATTAWRGRRHRRAGTGLAGPWQGRAR